VQSDPVAEESPLPVAYRPAFGLGLALLGACFAAGLAYDLRDGRLPPPAYTPYGRAGQLLDRNDAAGALREFRAGGAVQPSFDAYWGQAQALRELGDAPGELAALQLAAAEAPRDPRRSLELGGALLRAGRPLDGLVWLTRSVALDPQSPAAHNDLAIALVRTGRPLEAMAHLELAAALSRPPDPEIDANLQRLRAVLSRPPQGAAVAGP
jgi:Flp pilus assembly protein TadD